MVAWEDFLTEVLLEVEDCPQGLAVNAIRNAAIKLCQFGRVWAEYIDPISIVAGIADYELDPPSGSNIVTVLSAKSGAVGNQIDMKGPFSEEKLNKAMPGWKQYTTNQPTVFLFDGNVTMKLVGKPTEAISNGLEVRVALKPTTDSTEGPDVLLHDYHEAIGYGAKARLMAMPGKEWTNQATASYYEKLFNSALLSAWSKMKRGNGDKDLQINAQSLGGIVW